MGATRQRQMKMVLFAQGLGVAQSVWGSPRTDPERLHSLDCWAELARVAETGRFDAFFVADTLNLSPSITGDAIARPDPVALLSALSAVTSRIGLVGTSSTTYNDLSATALPDFRWQLDLTADGQELARLDSVAMMVGMAPFSGIDVGLGRCTGSCTASTGAFPTPGDWWPRPGPRVRRPTTTRLWLPRWSAAAPRRTTKPLKTPGERNQATEGATH